MRGQHRQQKDKEGDVRPFQVVEVGQTIGKQDTQSKEEHAVQHRVASYEQQEDAQKQQIVGHGNLGAYRHRLLKTIKMWDEQRNEQVQHQKTQ